jgi:hypothetical protein
MSTPIRRIRSGSCAAAPSGHAAGTAEQRDEVAAFHHSNTSSAVASRIARQGKTKHLSLEASERMNERRKLY